MDPVTKNIEYRTRVANYSHSTALTPYEQNRSSQIKYSTHVYKLQSGMISERNLS